MLEYVQHWTQSLKGRFAFSAIIAIYVIQFSILGWLALSFFLSLLFAARIRMVRTGRPMPILTSATPRLLLPATGEVRRGKMRKRGPAVRSYTTDEDCLAAALFLRDEKGDLFLWQLRSAELELDAEDGARVQVLGAIA